MGGHRRRRTRRMGGHRHRRAAGETGPARENDRPPADALRRARSDPRRAVGAVPSRARSRLPLARARAPRRRARAPTGQRRLTVPHGLLQLRASPSDRQRDLRLGDAAARGAAQSGAGEALRRRLPRTSREGGHEDPPRARRRSRRIRAGGASSSRKGA
jgi:hypothetical protein